MTQQQLVDALKHYLTTEAQPTTKTEHLQRHDAAIAKARQFKAAGDDEQGMTWLAIALHHERQAY